MILTHEHTSEHRLSKQGASYKGLGIFLDKVTPKPNLKSRYRLMNWKTQYCQDVNFS